MTTTTTAAPRRSANVALWVLQVLAAITFAMGGLNKVLGETQTVAGFEKMGMGDWFRYLIGALESAGAAALLIPILAGLAGLAFVGLMIGAIITQATVFDGEMVAIPAAVLVFVAIIAWGAGTAPPGSHQLRDSANEKRNSPGRAQVRFSCR